MIITFLCFSLERHVYRILILPGNNDAVEFQTVGCIDVWQLGLSEEAVQQVDTQCVLVAEDVDEVTHVEVVVADGAAVAEQASQVDADLIRGTVS